MLLLTAFARPPLQRPPALVLAGRLVRVRGADSIAVAGATVVAHGIGPARQGPVDSMRSDARGAFRFRIAHPDSGAVYVVSTRYDGIGYFSEPVVPGGAGGTGLVLAVFDTSAAGPPLEVGTRSVVVTRGAGNERRVLDIYQVVNAGITTRVGADTASATFSTRLPDGVVDPASGASDVAGSAIRFASGRVLVAAPLPPGDKQLVITYTLPAGSRVLNIPIDHVTAELELLLDDSTAQPGGSGLSATDPVALEGHTFRRFQADSLPAGTTVAVRFAASRAPSRLATLLAALAAGALLLCGSVVAFRRGRRAAATRTPPPAPQDLDLAAESRERLVAQLAALDERFAGRERDTPPEAWARYRARRDALKAALARLLARS